MNKLIKSYIEHCSFKEPVGTLGSKSTMKLVLNEFPFRNSLQTGCHKINGSLTVPKTTRL